MHFGNATDQAAWMCSASARIVQVPEPRFPHRSFGRALAVDVLAPPCANPGSEDPLQCFPSIRTCAYEPKILEILITPN